MKQGIALAGNILVDIVKRIDRYPALGMLSSISSISRAVGGCVPNVAIDLAKIDPALPLHALGRVGADAEGEYVLRELQRHGVSTAGVRIDPARPTSFSDVMALPSGERTFFHARGANAAFAPEDVVLPDCRMLHAGYLLLLDRFDAPDAAYGTAMARFLADARARGIHTSIDVVSESGGRFSAIVRPALPHCDTVIFNEIECCSVFGLSPRREDGTLDLPALREAMERTLAEGVKERVVVHCREAGLCLSRVSGLTIVPSRAVPEEVIRGNVGAGDAFCAGCLYAIYHGHSEETMLTFAAAAAAASLLAENAVDGMRSKSELEALPYPPAALPR